MSRGREKPLAAPGRIALALLSTLAVLAAAAATAFLGGPAAGAVPRSGADIDQLMAGDVTVLAVMIVRAAAVGLALWWLALMGAAWLAAWRGRDERVGAYARLLPPPLRLAVTLSLSPMLVSLPATMAGAQVQPPTGVPTSADPAEPPTSVHPPTQVLELSPLPANPEPRSDRPGSPTAGTTPAPGIPAPDGRAVTASPDDPAPPVASADRAACPTIVTRSDVHWFDQARAHLDDQIGRSSSDREAEAYWDRCVAHNAELLPDVDEPDIVRPGQVLELPELPRTT